MKSITIKVPEQFEEWLQQEARRRDASVEELLWEAIAEYRRKPQRRLRAAGAGASGDTDISVRIEELLASEWSKG